MNHVIGLARRAKHIVFQLTTYQNEQLGSLNAKRIYFPHDPTNGWIIF